MALHQGTSTKAWEKLQPLLPSRNVDYDFWWRVTGPQLAILLDAADYPLERQYEALLYHYHWTVPYLGPSFSPDTKQKWKCLLRDNSSPIELSWKWNTAKGKPDVRFTIEAIGPYTGTPLDPLNQLPSRELLYQMERNFPGTDMTQANHLLNTLFDYNNPMGYQEEVASGAVLASTVLFAPEFLDKGLRFKAYFLPRKLGQTFGDMSILEQSLAQLHPESSARKALHSFLRENPEGKLLTPFMVAVDCIHPSKSRLKLYLQSPHTSFSSLHRILTLGGLKPLPASHFSSLRDLVSSVLHLPVDFPDDAEFPMTGRYSPESPDQDAYVDMPTMYGGHVFHMDLAPGSETPEIKFYLQVRRYGPDDRAIAEGLTGWMRRNGRGEYCERYLRAVEGMINNGRLEDGKGVHTFMSFLIKPSGEVDVTSYLGNEVAEKREERVNGEKRGKGMRRRSDSR